MYMYVRICVYEFLCVWIEYDRGARCSARPTAKEEICGR